LTTQASKTTAFFHHQVHQDHQENQGLNGPQENFEPQSSQRSLRKIGTNNNRKPFVNYQEHQENQESNGQQTTFEPQNHSLGIV